jgi:hypothetical protein
MMLLLQVKSRPIDRLFFYDRSPVISARQSAAIVKAMQELGFIDADGDLLYDPRIGDIVSWAAGIAEQLGRLNLLFGSFNMWNTLVALGHRALMDKC